MGFQERDGLWFIGTVQSRSLSLIDLKKTPTANFVVKYTSSMTGGAINGNVACELSLRPECARAQACRVHWVLVEKVGVRLW